MAVLSLFLFPNSILEYRAIHCLFPSLSVYGSSLCLCQCSEPHYTSLSTVLLQISLGRPLSSSLLVPMLAQFLVTNLVSFSVHIQSISTSVFFICELILSDLFISNFFLHLLLSLASRYSEFFISICVGSCPVCPHPFSSSARFHSHLRGQSEHLS